MAANGGEFSLDRKTRDRKIQQVAARIARAVGKDPQDRKMHELAQKYEYAEYKKAMNVEDYNNRIDKKLDKVFQTIGKTMQVAGAAASRASTEGPGTSGEASAKKLKKTGKTTGQTTASASSKGSGAVGASSASLHKKSADASSDSSSSDNSSSDISDSGKTVPVAGKRSVATSEAFVAKHKKAAPTPSKDASTPRNKASASSGAAESARSAPAAATARAKEAVAVKGQLVVKSNTPTIEAKWSMSSEGPAYAYNVRRTPQFNGGEMRKMHEVKTYSSMALLFCGNYIGSFKNSCFGRIHEDITLEFRASGHGLEVSGRGQNVCGTFTIKGTVTQTGDIEMFKSSWGRPVDEEIKRLSGNGDDLDERSRRQREQQLQYMHILSGENKELREELRKTKHILSGENEELREELRLIKNKLAELVSS